MVILVTNDDGIYADGIQALRVSLSSIAEVYVVAPDRERSATGHGITVHHPLRVESVAMPGDGKTGWAVDGTPVDCVKLGVEALLPVKPDLVISGINRGPNLGTDVLYSGTVSAAVEGVIMGVPSMAVSLTAFEQCDYSYASVFAQYMAKMLSEKGLPPDTLLNVNVPSVPPGDINGVAITRLGVRRYKDVWDKRVDPRGRTYFWMGGEPVDLEDSPDIDASAVLNGYISVSPIHFDFTKYNLMRELEGWNIALPTANG